MKFKKVIMVFIVAVILFVFFKNNNKTNNFTNQEFKNNVMGMLDFARDEGILANNDINIDFVENDNILMIDNNKIKYNLDELMFSIEMTFNRNMTKEEFIKEIAKNTYMITFAFPSVAKYEGIDYIDADAYRSQESIDSSYYTGVIYKEINLENIKNGIMKTSEKMDLEYLKMKSEILKEDEEQLVIKNSMTIKKEADFSKLVGLDKKLKEEIRQKLENY